MKSLAGKWRHKCILFPDITYIANSASGHHTTKQRVQCHGSSYLACPRETKRHKNFGCHSHGMHTLSLISVFTKATHCPINTVVSARIVKGTFFSQWTEVFYLLFCKVSRSGVLMSIPPKSWQGAQGVANTACHSNKVPTKIWKQNSMTLPWLFHDWFASFRDSHSHMVSDTVMIVSHNMHDNHKLESCHSHENKQFHDFSTTFGKFSYSKTFPWHSMTAIFSRIFHAHGNPE